MSEDLVINIDGKEIKAKPGQMILQAAMEAGIYIPYLCYYPGTKPFGNPSPWAINNVNDDNNIKNCLTLFIFALSLILMINSSS